MAQTIVDLGLTKITQVNKNNQVRRTLAPGREGKRYWQIIRRPRANQLSVECFLDAPGQVPCHGNDQWICYHSMMALMIAASHRGKRITFFQPSQLEKAERYRRLVDGMIFQAISHQSGQAVWVVMWEQGK